MPVARFQLPDGRVARFDVPDGTTPEAAQQMMAAALKPKGPAPVAGEFDPTEGMNGFEKFVAGYGAAIPQIARGVGQALGLVSQADVDEAKRLDAPLMNSGAGMAGNITGNVAAFIPTVAIPGAATLRGAAAVGAGMGALQPVASDESRLQNTAVGGAAGAGGVALGRALAAGVQGARALAEPFTQSGRDKIAGRMIQRFADDPSSVARATNQPTITGAVPTLAEQTGDAGLARLQDSLRSVDPQINNMIGARLAENNAARVDSLGRIAGDSGRYDAAVQYRADTAAKSYKNAFAAGVDQDMAAALQPQIDNLMQRPSVQRAVNKARELAREDSVQLDSLGSVQGLHYLKLALDDAVEASAKNPTQQRLIAQTSRDLGSVLEQIAPEYKSAVERYARNSIPINRMDIGRELQSRALSNTSDLAGNPRMQANALLGMLRDEPALIRRATGGRSPANALSDVLTPDEMNLLRAVASETDRAAAVGAAANGPGSATAQRMASQNLLRQIIGPTGLPQSWADSVLANTLIGKPFNLIYGGVAEPRIQQALAQAVLDPAKAQQVLRAAQALPAPQRNALVQMLQQAAAQGARSAPPALAVER